MRSKSSPCLSFSARSGLTLVEVVVSTALLATVLVALLVAFRMHQRQLSQAYELNRAVEAIDFLLADWYSATDRFPSLPEMGRSGLHHNLLWRADLIEQREPVESVSLWVVRIGIYSDQAPSVELAHCDILISDLDLRDKQDNG